MITTYAPAAGLKRGGPEILTGAELWIDLLAPSREEEIAVESILGIEVPTREEMQLAIIRPSYSARVRTLRAHAGRAAGPVRWNEPDFARLPIRRLDARGHGERDPRAIRRERGRANSSDSIEVLDRERPTVIRWRGRRLPASSRRDRDDHRGKGRSKQSRASSSDSPSCVVHGASNRSR